MKIKLAPNILLGFCLISPIVSATAASGIKPVGANGQPLNLDFETGDLRDWEGEGQATQHQPIKGDTVFPRRNDMRSNHQGNYWIGGIEKVGDDPKGQRATVPVTLTP